jgi:hexosaminidase
MRTQGLLIVLATIFIIAAIAGAQVTTLWPAPKSASYGKTTQSISSQTFNFKCTGKVCSDILQQAFKRYTNLIFSIGPSNTSQSDITTLEVNVDGATPLALHMDESYMLQIQNGKAILVAPTEWGALRGLETFSQLVTFVYDWTKPNSIQYQIPMTPITVNDKPRFTWRALLVDTSRHYLTVKTILRAIDAMSYNKMNVLHWHIVDDQSFPLQSNRFPLLSQAGAWAPRAVYNQTTIQYVINYAKYRGIRVVPEFDTPAHATSWAKGYPFLIANCPNNEPVFDATSPQVYQFLSDLLSELTSSYFTDSFIHMGGDEVQYGCWKADPKIIKWMTDNHIASYEQLQGLYEKKIQDIVNGCGRTTILYEESFEHSINGGYSLQNNTVVDVWLSQAELMKVITAGYRAIMAFQFYLDVQIPNQNEEFYLWVDTWKDFYDNEFLPSSLNLTDAQRSLVLGGEASMWGEQVDATVFDERVWPRAAASAERFWSPEHFNSTAEAKPRLVQQRCRMVRRGINASPIQPDHCDLGPNEEF